MYGNLQRREEKVKRCIYQSKKKVNKQFGRKMDEDVNGKRKLFWKGVSNAKGGKVESCSRIKVGNGRLAQGEDEVRKFWNEYFEDLYIIDTQEQVVVYMCSFDGIRRARDSELKSRWARSRIQRPQVRRRSQEK